MNYINQEYKFNDFFRFPRNPSWRNRQINRFPSDPGINIQDYRQLKQIFKYNLQIFCGNVQADCINPIFFC